jgi:hypothetical protein
MCPGQSATFTSQAIADAYVTTGADGSLSSSNFGAAGALAVSASGLPQGEFQSVIKFSLAGATSSFNTQFGAGQWMIDSVTLQLTAAPHGNSIFNNVAAGQFAVSLMQNNSWVEGAGNGGTPTSDGISFDSLENTYINNALDQPLGVYEFGGNTIGANSYTLGLSSQLVADALSGGNVSLRLFAADSNVSYLFDSRTGGSTAFHPMITVDASVVPETGSVSLCAAALGILPLLQWRRRWMRRQR